MGPGRGHGDRQVRVRPRQRWENLLRPQPHLRPPLDLAIESDGNGAAIVLETPRENVPAGDASDRDAGGRRYGQRVDRPLLDGAGKPRVADNQPAADAKHRVAADQHTGLGDRGGGRLVPAQGYRPGGGGQQADLPPVAPRGVRGDDTLRPGAELARAGRQSDRHLAAVGRQAGQVHLFDADRRLPTRRQEPHPHVVRPRPGNLEDITLRPGNDAGLAGLPIEQGDTSRQDGDPLVRPIAAQGQFRGDLRLVIAQ